MNELKSIVDLTNAFSKFPSIGTKTAERMAYAILNMDKQSIDFLITSIENATTKIHPCPICGILTEDDKCQVCKDVNRDHSQCIVIPSSKDALLFESMNFHGIYHVLGGEISSYHGLTPDKLKIQELIKRIEDEKIKEIIIATNPNIEGDTTALYLAKILENKDVIVSRIGFGLPVGGQLDYADSLTIKRSFDNRTSYKKEIK